MIDVHFCSFIFPVFLIISALLIRSIFNKLSRPTTDISLPPSPPALPIIGHLHLLTPPLYKCFQILSAQYGPLLYLRFGASRCLLVSSASIAAEIFKTHDLAFASQPLFAFSDKLQYGTSGFINAPYGDYWRFMKRLCVKELLGTRQLERSRPVRREEIERLLRRVMEIARDKEAAIDMGAELMRLTNNTTCRMVMSTRCSEQDGEAERVIQLVKEAFELAAKMCFGDVLGPLKKLGFWVYGKQAMDVTRRYDEILERVLKEHEDRWKSEGVEREDKDLMDLLLEICQDDEEAEVKITRTHIKAFFLDLFIAGTETSAEAMQWVMAELINHPCVFKKVREEIESIVGKTKLVEELDTANLPYLQAVVKETLRLHPPGPVTLRECRQRCKINGFDIPEKTAVAINLYAIMRDEDSWDDPNEFCPERFFVSFKEKDKDQYQSEETGQTFFNFVPFRAGRRGCPGTTLAFSLMNTAIAALVQCFDWKVFGDGDKVDLQSGPGMSLGMARPLI
ncbi:cytochrome P450 705A5-like [Juglans microcarpa x Juglans regia]|uniref:cytochrome P450 705A5-like n=1 Tax=Juglans microcarpa x Juglans regia TaxID=2249226 RepID=UPI001B7F4078|nr:cytochrome P450 705A5-like [Juglans microcarpa x Juglans regia]